MSDSKPLLSRRLDRRAFLGGAGFAAGAVVATTLVPLSVVHAVSAEKSVAFTSDPSWTGHVDDACGHWPPYSYDIPYNVVSEPEAFAGNVHPADHFLMI